MFFQRGYDKNFIVFLYLAVLLAVLGIVTSFYAVNHYNLVLEQGFTQSFCNINNTINCDTVAASSYSKFLGVSLGWWGVSFFIIALLVAVLGLLWQQTVMIYQYYLLIASVGIITSIILGIISLSSIGSICLYCVTVYTICLAQGVLLWWYRRYFRKKIPATIVIPALLTMVVICIVLFSVSSASQLPLNLASTIKKPLLLDDNSVEIPVNRSAYKGLGEDYRLGKDNADVTIVEFVDFQCPACKHMSSLLKKVKNDYGNQVLLVLKNYPLDVTCNNTMKAPLHQHACVVAKMARCAGMLGKFWEYHDLAFGLQEKISTDNAYKWAQQVGLSNAVIQDCKQNETLLSKIQKDIKLANKLGVNGTPTVFINGRKFLGKNEPELHLIIDRLLAQKRRLSGREKSKKIR